MGDELPPQENAARLHSDVARQSDITLIRTELHSVGGRVDSIRDEMSNYVIDHAQEHTRFAGDWEKRWSGIAVDLAYRRGLIGFPRLVLEWLRQYLTTLLALGALLATIIGFATGSVTVGVGP